MKKSTRILVCLCLVLSVFLLMVSCEFILSPGTSLGEDTGVIKRNDTLASAIEHIDGVEQEFTSAKMQTIITTESGAETVTDTYNGEFIIDGQSSVQFSMETEIEGEFFNTYVKDNYQYISMGYLEESINMKTQITFAESMKIVSSFTDFTDFFDIYDTSASTISIKSGIATLTLVIPEDEVGELAGGFFDFENSTYENASAVFTYNCETGAMTGFVFEIECTDNETGDTYYEINTLSDINSVTSITFPSDLDEYKFFEL